MKNTLLGAMALIALASSATTFAAGEAPATLQTANGQIMYTASTTSTGGLYVSEIKSLDDRSVTITFSEELAEEPVRFKLLEQVTKKEVVASSINVNTTDRKIVEVKLAQPLETAKKYTLALSYAQAMSGHNIIVPENEDKSMSGTTVANPTTANGSGSENATTEFNAPEELTTSKETKAQADAAKSDEELKTANDAAVAEAEKQPLPPARLNSAPEMNAAGESGSLAVSGKDAYLVNGATRLPKTGAEETLIMLVSLGAGAATLYRKKYAKVS